VADLRQRRGRATGQDIAALTLARDLHDLRLAQRSGAYSPRLPGVAGRRLKPAGGVERPAPSGALRLSLDSRHCSKILGPLLTGFPTTPFASRPPVLPVLAPGKPSCERCGRGGNDSSSSLDPSRPVRFQVRSSLHGQLLRSGRQTPAYGAAWRGTTRIMGEAVVSPLDRRRCCSSSLRCSHNVDT
jgi:hypothetical protein